VRGPGRNRGVKLPREVWIALVALLAAGFAWTNRFERVTLRLGVVSIRDVPLAVICLAFVLVGMAAMLLLSLPHDRRTRDLLRQHGLLEEGKSVTPAAAPPPVAPTDATRPDLAPTHPPIAYTHPSPPEPQG
jgi:uncharacterized integral membrane protein